MTQDITEDSNTYSNIHDELDRMQQRPAMPTPGLRVHLREGLVILRYDEHLSFALTPEHAQRLGEDLLKCAADLDYQIREQNA